MATKTKLHSLISAEPVSRVSASDRCPFSKLNGHGSLSDQEILPFSMEKSGKTAA